MHLAHRTSRSHRGGLNGSAQHFLDSRRLRCHVVIRGCRRRRSTRCWVRRRAGHAAKPTARGLGLPTSTVRDYLRRCGGIRPDPRRRSPGRLSFAEREEISRGLAAGLSLRVIASRLGRSPSTVSREVATHGGVTTIEPRPRTSWRGREPRVRKPASSRPTPRCLLWSQRSWSGAGHRSRSPAG
jgi:hypothetical protein